MGGRLVTLKARADFLRVAAARRRAVAPGLVLQAVRRPERSNCGEIVRVGFTASKKIGNAVIRNRAKRRLRSVAAAILSREGRPETDYVLIARATTVDRPYEALIADLEAALRRVNHDKGKNQLSAAEEE